MHKRKKKPISCNLDLYQIFAVYSQLNQLALNCWSKIWSNHVFNVIRTKCHLPKLEARNVNLKVGSFFYFSGITEEKQAGSWWLKVGSFKWESKRRRFYRNHGDWWLQILLQSYLLKQRDWWLQILLQSNTKEETNLATWDSSRRTTQESQRRNKQALSPL